MQYVFGDFMIDPDRRELSHGPELIATGPQVFDLLVYQVENREHVVSRDSLLDAVWGGRIVSESTLANHVNAARKAVGDSGQEQRLIQTVARKGFRFVGDIKEIPIADNGASLKARVTTSDEAAAPVLVIPDRPSIAILPFLNLSGDPEQDYFADGVVEDVIMALSRIRWLFVIARNSSFTYKEQAVDVKQVGRELGVRYVLEGSVRKAANRVRITGQLIDATSGDHLWAERFEGTLDDVFDLQDQVTASVVGAIAPHLERAEIGRATLKPTQSLDAYDYYLRGMANLHRGSREATSDALPMFTRAIELDPNFASAYAMAAWCHFWRKVNGWMTDRTREAGMALAHLFAGRFDVASSWAEKAHKDMPSFLMVVGIIAASHALAGRSDDAQRAMSRLCRLDPTLRISGLADWLPIHRPKDLATFADGLLQAGLPE